VPRRGAPAGTTGAAWRPLESSSEGASAPPTAQWRARVPTPLEERPSHRAPDHLLGRPTARVSRWAGREDLKRLRADAEPFESAVYMSSGFSTGSEGPGARRLAEGWRRWGAANPGGLLSGGDHRCLPEAWPGPVPWVLGHVGPPCSKRPPYGRGGVDGLDAHRFTKPRRNAQASCWSLVVESGLELVRAARGVVGSRFPETTPAGRRVRRLFNRGEARLGNFSLRPGWPRRSFGAPFAPPILNSLTLDAPARPRRSTDSEGWGSAWLGG